MEASTSEDRKLKQGMDDNQCVVRSVCAFAFLSTCVCAGVRVRVFYACTPRCVRVCACDDDGDGNAGEFHQACDAPATDLVRMRRMKVYSNQLLPKKA